MPGLPAERFMYKSSATVQVPRLLSRKRRRVFVLVLVLILVTGQELVFRGLFCVPEVRGFNRVRYQMMAGTHPSFGATVRTGLVYDRLLFESEPDGFSEVHSLNLYGFRSRDFAIDPPRERRRILLLGDSVTEGQGAPDSATIAAVWERQLAKDGLQAEVLNLGVTAATLVHLTLLARDAIPLLRPTDVVIIIYANDLPAPPYPPQLAGPGPVFPRANTPWYTPRSVELIWSVARGEPIYRRWPHSLLPFFPAVPSPTSPWTGKPGPPRGLDPDLYRAMRTGRINPWLSEQAQALPGMLAQDFAHGGLPTVYLGRLAELCSAAKANLLVVYVPFYGITSHRYAPALKQFGMDPAIADALAVDPVYRRQNVSLRSVCAALSLPLADTTDALIRAESEGVPQFWSYDSHPRPAGYATIAGVVHEAWKRSFHGR
jgi:hypothetical protein